MSERKRGIIVNVASSAAYNPMALWAVYSATKKYVTWLTSILRREYESSGITIQTVCPMMVATKMSKVCFCGFIWMVILFRLKKLHSLCPMSMLSPSPLSILLEEPMKQQDTSLIKFRFFSFFPFLTRILQVEIMDLLPQFVKDHFLTKMSKGTRAAALRKKEREAKAQ